MDGQVPCHLGEVGRRLFDHDRVDAHEVGELGVVLADQDRGQLGTARTTYAPTVTWEELVFLTSACQPYAVGSLLWR